MDYNTSTISIERKKSAQLSVFKKVYIWMSLALCITGLTALIIANNNDIMYSLMQDEAIFWIIMIAEIALVMVIASRIGKMSLTTATILFILYSILNGVSMSLIFIIYTETSIAATFFVTAGTFAAISLYGYITKKDLSSWGSILIMGLIGIVIASVVNMFMASETLYWIISYAGVLVFVGLTAYDTQQIKKALLDPNLEVDENLNKLALFGALKLYLDFINLFLHLLRIIGGRD
ncbi:MAG: Bax inhibitor-1/YccA family protein [Bacteroidaceae bacterium]|nr:Bax inhibitor-1/YccA family protein [Bacteroidaceae bacterium]